jgi:CRISPR system Cascade subunit CasA
VVNYLNRWRHRFDLFARDRPFYQTRAIDHAYEDPMTKLTHELASQANRVTLFDHTAPAQMAFSPAQAARYLVAHQAFAVGGLLSGRVASEKSADAAPLCKAAVCLAKGPTLFHTLMYNLVAYDPQNGVPFDTWGEDRPAWERDREPVPADRRPDGYLDLLTWQSRRILLIPEQSSAGSVTVPRVVIMKGEQFPDDWELQQGETMVPFRQTKARPPFPLALSEERALWRDSLALLQTTRAQVDSSLKPPKLVQWLSDLVVLGALGRQTTIPIDVYGVTTDQAVVRFWRHERFPLPTAVLDDAALVARIGEMLEIAESAGEALRDSVREIARETLPSGSRETRAPASPLAPDRSYWPALELPFFQTVQRLTAAPDDDERTRALATWAQEVGRVARQAFAEAVEPLQDTPRALLAIAQHERQFVMRLGKTRRRFLNRSAEEVMHG